MGKKSKAAPSANGMAGSGLAAAPRNGTSNGTANGSKANGSNRRPREAKNEAGPETITLPNGDKIPVAPPPGIDAGMYQQALAYLKANPEVAMQTQEQVRRMGNPMMAQAASANLQDPEYRKKMEVLREDPDLKPIFDDIAASGTAGMERHWNDVELMSKISRKMGEMGLAPQPAPQPPGKTLPVRPTNLHDAAKAGDAEATASLLEEGCDPNGRDSRGITPLGVAVGFNRLSVVKALLAAGADVELTDGKGNTALHYAAGYGRQEAAEMLLGAGAKTDPVNSDGQTPVQIAELKHETAMVKFLSKAASGSAPSQGKAAGAQAPQKEVPDADKYL
jgi:hypothetical protein